MGNKDEQGVKWTPSPLKKWKIVANFDTHGQIKCKSTSPLNFNPREPPPLLGSLTPLSGTGFKFKN